MFDLSTKQQINTNNGNQWKSTNGIDSQESVQQWNEFMKQEQNQPNTSYAQAVKQSPRNIYYSNCQNCGKTNKKSKGHMQYFEGPLCHKCNIQKKILNNTEQQEELLHMKFVD